jgi:DNA-binding MarR family transcriptional regulator
MILVEITETGRQAASAFRPIVHQHQREWFEVLGETQQQQFLVALHRLQEILQDSD